MYACMYVCLSKFDFCIGTYLEEFPDLIFDLFDDRGLVNITQELKFHHIFAIISLCLTKNVS